jgi:hypothetical protein
MRCFEQHGTKIVQINENQPTLQSKVVVFMGIVVAR